MIAKPKIFPDHLAPSPDAPYREGFESLDARFDALLPSPKPALRRCWRGAEWAEGPVYLPAREAVVFSDIPNNRMLRYDCRAGETTVYREPANFANGNTLDLEGRILTALHLPHAIGREEPDGSVTILVDSYEGKPLNSPNDLVVKSDGAIWFTDPPYGILSDREGKRRESAVGGNFVYRFDPSTEELTVVASDMDRPNGLAFSPDESILYVADTGEPKNVLAFEVVAGGKALSNPREFIAPRPGASDGFRCDVEGNIWTSAGDGIQCFTPEGELIGKILVPESRCANCCFGGPDFRSLYIAGDTSLYEVELAVEGARPKHQSSG